MADKISDNTFDISRMMHDYAEVILDHFQEGIYITDGEANTVYLNDRYEQISGLKRAEMIGRNMKELVESGVISMSGTLAVLRTRESVTIEQSFRTGRRAVITSMPVFENDDENGQIVMVVTAVQETTEIYRIKKELKKKERQNLHYARRLEEFREKNGDAAEEEEEKISLKTEVAKLEAQYIERAFEKYGNVRAAAESLNIDSSTFVRKRQKYEEMGLLPAERYAERNPKE